MKMYLGNTPINSLNIKHYEMDTNSATVQPSDLQAGVTCYGRGKKITGTGKSFEFAFYGESKTNSSIYIPTDINVIEIASTTHPIQLSIELNTMRDKNFSEVQTLGNIVANSTIHPITVQVTNNIMKISCNETVNLQLFYGKDNYV